GNISAQDTAIIKANKLYREKKYAEAEKMYNYLADNSTDAAIKQPLIYNKGVSLSRQNKLEESIAAYKQAVILNPKDEDARVNLQKALLELKKKQPPPPEKKEDKNKKKDKKENKDQQQQNKSNLTKKEVEQRLKALQQHEQQVQRKIQQNQTRSAGQQEKDW
ncbi:MAG: tetratricopeptide repeat protein, partial [Chitinophagaceae bacterium]|nr:tetratricopeptide repeat protein [Chitinophagaceae bacterium]